MGSKREYERSGLGTLCVELELRIGPPICEKPGPLVENKAGQVWRGRTCSVCELVENAHPSLDLVVDELTQAARPGGPTEDADNADPGEIRQLARARPRLGGRKR